jgi:hypothetical protein
MNHGWLQSVIQDHWTTDLVIGRRVAQKDAAKGNHREPGGTKRHETAPNGTKRNAFLLLFGNISGLGVA